MESRYEYYEMLDAPERPDPGDGDDTCKHGNVTYGAGDCDLCDAEEEALAQDCGVCGGPVAMLGILGTVAHVRCRNCGHESAREI